MHGLQSSTLALPGIDLLEVPLGQHAPHIF